MPKRPKHTGPRKVVHRSSCKGIDRGNLKIYCSAKCGNYAEIIYFYLLRWCLNSPRNKTCIIIVELRPNSYLNAKHNIFAKICKGCPIRTSPRRQVLLSWADVYLLFLEITPFLFIINFIVFLKILFKTNSYPSFSPTTCPLLKKLHSLLIYRF